MRLFATRQRAAGASSPHPDRRALERRGWRTLLEFREDHVRDPDGVLLAVVPRWTAEAERANGRVVAASVTDGGPDDVWPLLRRQTELSGTAVSAAQSSRRVAS